MNKILFFFLTVIFCFSVQGQIRYKTINIPDIPGFKTLKCDFHVHTIYSDGYVTPEVRIFEAASEGLDAIALTDHVYGQPGKNWTNDKDHNKAYEKAGKYASLMDVLLINGGEISRGMPPGHVNALFLEDANQLETPDFMDAYQEAKKQDAFIFWNHPGDQPVETRWHREHQMMYDKGLLYGIEVVNTHDYYPEAHQWCLDKNLTMMGNSDAHLPMELVYDFSKSKHRPMTLVFAKERSVASIKEALFSKRTVVYHEDILIGREEYLKPLFEQSVQIMKTDENRDKKKIELAVRNNSQIPFHLKLKNPGPDFDCVREITLEPMTLYLIDIQINKEQVPVNIKFIIKNLFVKPNQGLEYNFPVSFVSGFD